MNRMMNTSVESLSSNGQYDVHYSSACREIDFVVKSLAERPGRVIDLAMDAGGQTAVQALFDAVMDHGHRMVLVRTLDAPSLQGWVRDKLEVFLYGGTKQQPSLFGKSIH